MTLTSTFDTNQAMDPFCSIFFFFSFLNIWTYPILRIVELFWNGIHFERGIFLSFPLICWLIYLHTVDKVKRSILFFDYFSAVIEPFESCAMDINPHFVSSKCAIFHFIQLLYVNYKWKMAYFGGQRGERFHGVRPVDGFIW